MATFIVDCPECKAKVGAEQKGIAEARGWIDEIDEPYGERIYVGKCPKCGSLLVGQAQQIHFEGFNSGEDEWTDVVRVFPKPAKSFSSYSIPKIALNSLKEADRSLQSNANTAACVMFGRALAGC